MRTHILIVILLGSSVAKGDINHVDLRAYEQYAVLDLNDICANFQTTQNINQICAEQLEVVCNDENLLITMLDASAKLPVLGASFSSPTDYGNFDQCMSINHAYSGGKIIGEHCTYGLIVPDFLHNSSITYMLAVCRPKECSAADYNAILQNLTSANLPLFQDMGCQTVDSNSTYTTADIITIVIFGLVGLLMIGCTGADVYYYLKGIKCEPILLAFSVLTNGRKLLHISKHSTSKEQIEIFHGLRAISMIWVVAGHAMAMWLMVTVTDVDRVATWRDQMYAVYITAAPLSVDTFFFMSGFLLAFLSLKQNSSLVSEVASIPLKIIHRYFRLTPAMLMIYLVFISIFSHLGSGPIWKMLVDAFSQICRENALSFFLYYQNYAHYDNMCLLQTWYLSADFQMFIVALFILIPLSLIITKVGLPTAMWAMLGLNLFLSVMPMVHKFIEPDYSNDYATHFRLVTYFIGVMLAAFMRKTIDKPFLYLLPEKRRNLLNVVIWPVIILGMLAVVLCYQVVTYQGETSKTLFSYFFMRPAWCIGLSWITYSCYHGRGGFINWLLCRPIFQILGRLTYCIYLVHFSVIIYVNSIRRTKWYFSDFMALFQFFGYYSLSVIIAIFWTLAFESPFITIEKYVFGGLMKPKTNQHRLEPTEHNRLEAKAEVHP